MFDSIEKRYYSSKIHEREITIVFIDIIFRDFFVLFPKEKYLQGNEILCLAKILVPVLVVSTLFNQGDHIDFLSLGGSFIQYLWFYFI